MQQYIIPFFCNPFVMTGEVICSQAEQDTFAVMVETAIEQRQLYTAPAM